MLNTRGLFILCLVTLATTANALGQTPTPQPATPPVQVDVVEPPSWLYNDIACAPSLTTKAPPALRVLGSQDTVVKHMLSPGDTLVVTGGASAGLEPGQRFFVRRNVKTFGTQGPDAQHPVSVHTAGWVQILGVDASVATASIVHACEGMLLDDYLEPFVSPVIAAKTIQGTLPQYTNMGLITNGDENTWNVAIGQMTGINRGSNAGVFLGQRYLVFRDKRKLRNDVGDRSEAYIQNIQHLPLVEVGEVLVVAVRPDDATVQVTVARDSISIGDLIAEIR